jgi:Domain of unknown function (DUF1906)
MFWRCLLVSRGPLLSLAKAARLLVLLLVYASIPAVGNVASSAATLPPFLFSPHTQYPACPGKGTATEQLAAFDFSQPADAALVHAAQALKVTAVLRYYDWEDKSLSSRLDHRSFSRRSEFNRQFHFPWRPGPQFHGKILSSEELRTLHSAGLKVGVVFQHFSSDPRTFLDAARASYDAGQALDLAHHLSQPPATVIFFGVDFDVSPSMYRYVHRYFESVHSYLKRSPYNLGVYGSGYVCRRLQQDGLVTSCWLSQSTAFQESTSYDGTGSWALKQCATRKAFPGSNVQFDPNVATKVRPGLFW